MDDGFVQALGQPGVPLLKILVAGLLATLATIVVIRVYRLIRGRPAQE